MQTADRWRTLDPDNSMGCVLAAQILHPLGATALAWQYLNSPTALFAANAQSWQELAASLSRQDDWELAELAYRQATAASPYDAQLIWDRAQNLERAGRRDEAKALYQHISNGRWHTTFANIQASARFRLHSR